MWTFSFYNLISLIENVYQSLLALQFKTELFLSFAQITLNQVAIILLLSYSTSFYE